MKKVKLILLLFIGVGIVATSCSDDFSEEDLLNKKMQQANDAQAAIDSAAQDKLEAAIEALNEAGNLLDYTVTVTSDNDPVEGVSVTANNQAGASTTLTTDATGQAVFTDIMLGAHTIYISSPNFLDVSYLVDFGRAEEGVHYEIIDDNVIPIEISEASTIELYSLSGLQTATIKGRVEIELDLTNSTPEIPQDMVIRANLDATGLEGEHSRAENSSGIFQTIYVAGSFEFTEGDIGTATVDNTTGEYSIIVPATEDGADIELLYPAVEADQTLAFTEVNGEYLGAQIGSQAARFGSSVTAAVVPTVSGVVAEFPMPADPGRGFTISNFREMPRGFVTGGSVIDDLPFENNFAYTKFRGSFGDGYNMPPLVTVSDPDINEGQGEVAELYARFQWTSIVSTITDATDGSGYTPGESVTVTVNFLDVDGGIVYTDNLSVTAEGDGTLPAGDLDFTLEFRDKYDIVSSYFTSETEIADAEVIISGGAGSGASATLATEGDVISFNVSDAGDGYTSIPTITMSHGTASLEITDMAFQYAFDLDNSGVSQGYVVLPEIGYNYSYAPGASSVEEGIYVVSFDPSGFIDSDDFLSNLQSALIVDGGDLAFDNDDFFDNRDVDAAYTEEYSYTVPTPIVVEPTHEQAAADVLVNADGEVTGLNITSTGSGYTSEFDVTLTVLAGLTGSGAAIDLNGFDLDEDTGEVSWTNNYTLVSKGSEYTDDVNIGSEDFSGTASVTVKNGETKVVNVNYGTGDRVEEVN